MARSLSESIPIDRLPSDLANNTRFVLADIDDTISSHGKITNEAYTALWRLHDAGIAVIPITGRCAGWVDHIARMWPVKGVVGENGAFYAFMNSEEGQSKLKLRFYDDLESPSVLKQKFVKIQDEIFKSIPDLALASDQPYRLFDLAIDFCEDVPPHSRDQIQQIQAIFHKYGAKTKVSSIHVNGWFGTYDKLTMTKLFCQEILGISPLELLECAIFIGDSPNDQPMFEFFPHTVGVANLTKFAQDLTQFPEFLTFEEAGKGFAEFVDMLLEKKERIEGN